MKYIVNPTDAVGRDLWPGIAFPPERFVKVGDPVDEDQLPKGAAKKLLAKGVIAPALEEKS